MSTDAQLFRHDQGPSFFASRRSSNRLTAIICISAMCISFWPAQRGTGLTADEDRFVESTTSRG